MAPHALGDLTADDPVPPEPSKTRTLLPALAPTTRSACSDVSPASGTTAASPALRLIGARPIFSAGTATNCA